MPRASGPAEEPEAADQAAEGALGWVPEGGTWKAKEEEEASDGVPGGRPGAGGSEEEAGAEVEVE